MPDLPDNALPALPFIDLGPNGATLSGVRCDACGTTVPDVRRACPKCGDRALKPVTLGRRGVVRQFTVVHRSYPGVPTPFVAAVVDLDDGGSLQATLIDVEPDPDSIAFGLPVELVFRDTGQRDGAGTPFVGYVFRPIEGAAA